jgi:SAM-dependent methyltransferase
MEPTTSIAGHYGSHDLVARMLGALRAAGHATEPLTATTLSLVDQLHGGGINGTIAMAQFAGVRPGMAVLDAGCGVGGSSRFLAENYGCRVEAIDLTPEYVAATERLDALCGIADRISVRQASVTELPFAAERFDLVWCQNVSMNVADKQKMFAEAFRVLKTSGHYVLSHVALGRRGEPYYPLPWAREPSYSFPGTPEALLDGLRTAGFVNLESRLEEGPPSVVSRSEELGPATVMGADMPARQANVVRSRAEGRLVGMLVRAERAG